MVVVGPVSEMTQRKRIRFESIEDCRMVNSTKYETRFFVLLSQPETTSQHRRVAVLDATRSLAVRTFRAKLGSLMHLDVQKKIGMSKANHVDLNSRSTGSAESFLTSN